MTISKKETVAKRFEGIPSKVEKVSEELSCELNPLEWSSRAKELAEAHSATEAMKNRKKSIMAELNADLKIAEGKETKLSNIVSTNREQRDVTVEVTYDYELGLVKKRRTDTNEEISSREMTTNERQAGLFDNESLDANDFIESRHKEAPDEQLEEKTDGAEALSKESKKAR